jgi:hypothetical protein
VPCSCAFRICSLHPFEQPFEVTPLGHCTRQTTWEQLTEDVHEKRAVTAAKTGYGRFPEPVSQEKAKASKLEHNSTRPAAVTAKNPSDTKS